MENLDLGALYGKSFPLVAKTIVEHGGTPAGAPFGLYHQWGPDVVDVEVGFPVSRRPWTASPARRRLARGAGQLLVAGRAGSARDPRRPLRGPRGGQREAAGVDRERGLEPAGGLWESYVDDPGAVPEAEVRTEIFWPVAPAG